MAQDEFGQPNVQSSSYRSMRSYWDLIDAILGGVEAMRAAGERYLPRFQEENRQSKDSQGRSYDPYDLRRRKAPFTNIYEDISISLASKPFAKRCTLDDSTPENYKKIAENIDGMGNNLHVFAQDVYRVALDYAITWILVEFVKATPAADGKPLSIAQEQEQGLRPYFVHVHSTRMLAVYSDYLDGVEIFTECRIHEPIIVVNNFVEYAVDQVRVLFRPVLTRDPQGKALTYGGAEFILYRSIVDQQTSQSTWQIVDAGPLSIGVIPIVPFITGTRRLGTWTIEPALRGIAWMQVDEFQQESNLQNVMDLTCFPMLAGQGVTPPKEGSIVVGPRTVLYAPMSGSGQAGRWEVIEPAGTSIGAVTKRLEDTRNEMRDLGKQPLTMQNLTVITTGQVAVKANSVSQKWAIMFKDTMEQAFKFMAMWLGDKTTSPKVNVFTDFGVVLDDGKGFDAALNMNKAGILSNENTLKVGVRYGYLPDDFDYKENDKQLAEQAANAPPVGGMIDPATGLPVDPVTGQVIVQKGKPPPAKPGQQQPPPAGGRKPPPGQPLQ